MKFNFKNVLVLSPHTDDVEFGAGGMVHKLVLSGSDVVYVAFSICEESVPCGFPKDILDTEVRNSTFQLGIKKENVFTFRYKVRKFSYARQEILEDIVKIRKKFKPFDLVLVPSIHDIHQDHEVICREGIRAFKNTTLLGYELGWNLIHFDTQCFCHLEEEDIDSKIKAISQYKSQGFRKYSDPNMLKSLALVHGLQAGCVYAEAFEVIRLFI